MLVTTTGLGATGAGTVVLTDVLVVIAAPGVVAWCRMVSHGVVAWCGRMVWSHGVVAWWSSPR